MPLKTQVYHKPTVDQDMPILPMQITLVDRNNSSDDNSQGTDALDNVLYNTRHTHNIVPPPEENDYIYSFENEFEEEDQ